MNIPRKLLIGAMALISLNSACNLPAQTKPPPLGTILPADPFIATATLNIATPTALIPITGMDKIASLQCQFCVNDEIHAVLVLAEPASFLVSQPVTGVNCLTAQVVNDRRIVICRGAQQTSFTLNVCMDGSNCVQLPIALETCPLLPQTRIGTQPTASPVHIVPTPIVTMSSPTIATSTSTPPAAQAGVARSPFTATAAPPFRPVTTPFATSLPSGLKDPAEFAKWYFGTVWRERNYQDLWNNYLTPSYKSNVGSGIYADYIAWWDSVERVDVHSVNVLENDGMRAWVRVNATFYMKDGRVVSNQPYEYNLLYDATRGTWMFDYQI